MKKSLLLYLFFLLISPNSLFSQDKVWTGAVDNLWHKDGNWSPSGKPGSGDKVLIADGANVTLSTSETIKGLNIGLEYIPPSIPPDPPDPGQAAETGSLTITSSGSLTTTGNSVFGSDGVNLAEGSSGFENYLEINGALNISGCSKDGLDINLFSSVLVTGTLSISGVGDDGIELNDELENTNTGTITITNSDEIAIYAKGNIFKDLTNDGTILISGAKVGIDGSGVEWDIINNGTTTISNTTVKLFDDGTNFFNYGTFNGIGFIENGNDYDFSNESGSTLSPGVPGGATIGTLTFEQQVDFSNIAINITIDGDGAYDRIVVGDILETNGSVILSNTTLNLSVNYTPSYGVEFMILEKGQPGPITGAFNGFPNNGTVNYNDVDFMISYSGGDGNDMVLTSLGPLPVELITFTAQALKNKIKLDWATATETNNDFFTIERSKDARTFQEVTTVPGKVNSLTLNEYSIFDKSPLKGLSYYRLKQTDLDGQFSYSEIETVEFNGHKAIEVFPTIVADHLTVETDEDFNSTSTLVIRNLTGKVFKTFSMAAKEYSKEISLIELLPGNYFITVYNRETIETFQFTKT